VFAVGDLVMVNMPGSPLMGCVGLVVEPDYWKTDSPANEFSCVVSLLQCVEGMSDKMTIRSKWLKLISKG